MPGAFALGTMPPNSPKGSSFQSIQPSVLPVGVIEMFAGSSAPVGWLLCDGSNVSRVTYASLFSVIGTLYGSGNGYSTFTLPDFRSRSPIGAGNGANGLSSRTLGTTVGAEGSTISTSHLPTFSMDSGAADGNHTHPTSSVSYNGSYPPMTYTGGNTPSTWTWSVAAGNLFSALTVTSAQTALQITTSGNHNHTRTNSSPSQLGVVQPCVVVNYIIKA